MVGKEIIAIIPARGGSKRIPKKNIAELAGKPMIAWTIEAALQSEYIKRVIVSTDDVEIAEVAKKYGAEVPFLRTQHNDDFSTVSQATISTITQLQSIPGFSAEVVVQLMANCPVRNQTDIDAAIHNFLEKDNSFQISCFPYGFMNPWWANQLDANYIPTPLFKDISTTRSQDLPKLYCPTGAIWIARTEKLIEHGTFYGLGYTFFPVSWKKAIDIDDYEDFDLARLIMNDLYKNDQ